MTLKVNCNTSLTISRAEHLMLFKICHNVRNFSRFFVIIPVEYIISKGHFEVRDPLLKIKPLLIINTACCLLMKQHGRAVCVLASRNPKLSFSA